MLSKKLIGTILAIALGVASATQAAESNHAPATQYAPAQHSSWFWFLIRDKDYGNKPQVKAPEIDPATAFSGLTMLAGGLAVIRGRRFIKK